MFNFSHDFGSKWTAKPEPQKHERNTKPRNDDNDDDNQPSCSQCIHPVLPH